MSNGDLNWIANYIWGIADDVPRDLYVRGKYRDVILPMTVLRRLDAVLEDGKPTVLDMKATLDAADVVEQDAALRQAADQAIYNAAQFTLRDLRARASRQQLEADFRAWLDGFSPNVQDVLDSFEFRNQILRLSKADALGSLIEKLTSPDINLSPEPVMNADGSVRHTGRAGRGMDADDLLARHGEHVEGVVEAEVVLDRERESGEVERREIGRAHAGLIETPLIVRHLVAGAPQGRPQPRALQCRDLVAARGFDGVEFVPARG